VPTRSHRALRGTLTIPEALVGFTPSQNRRGSFRTFPRPEGLQRPGKGVAFARIGPQDVTAEQSGSLRNSSTTGLPPATIRPLYAATVTVQSVSFKTRDESRRAGRQKGERQSRDFRRVADAPRNRTCHRSTHTRLSPKKSSIPKDRGTSNHQRNQPG
jgi:hypothetical protein